MFEYEREVRIVKYIDFNSITPIPTGFDIPWKFDRCIESIWVHPDADQSFMDTVAVTVETYAPTLKDKVAWSAMNAQPPL
jgi:hypothetical protein